MKKEPKVNKVNEFLEIASDFEDPLEVIRESLSNSYDARAENIDIRIRSRPSGSDIIIEDDGEGMNRRDLESFFDLGNSRKEDKIGYKGHGTKIFYKSDRIVVNTSRDGHNLRAVMDEPWEKLNEKTLPEYELTEEETRVTDSGTYIRIENFRSGQGFNAESLTYQKIHHYLKWKTIGGSTKHFFEEDFHEMSITADLDEEIDDTRDQLELTNKFEFPEEQHEPGPLPKPATSMCKVYGPRELTINHEQGVSTIQLVGMVGGKQARNELPTWGRHSAQFGIWLAKDYIKVERLNEAISHDNEYIHFMFIANCQDIELSANREKIRNKASSVYQELENKLNYFLSKVTADPWLKKYMKQREIGEIHRRADSQLQSVQNRRENIEQTTSFSPSNSSEVAIGLERSNGQDGNQPIRIADYQADSEVSAILKVDGEYQPAAVHQTLTDHFEQELPLESLDKVVCWTLGDPDDLREISRSGYAGGELDFDFGERTINYRNGTEYTIDIVSVQDRLSSGT